MQHAYKADLTIDNERSAPLTCMACKRVPGLVWRGMDFLCYGCDRASQPLGIDGATIAAALNPPHGGQPVVTARTAIEMLERSVGGRA